MRVVARSVVLGFVVAQSLSGCYDKSTSETPAVEEKASGEDETEAGKTDVGVDEDRQAQTDAADDAAFDVGTVEATNDSCRVVEPADDTNDDAGASIDDPNVPNISGVIAANGECLANVRVCLTYYNSYGTVAIGDFTNQYGEFELPTETDEGSVEYGQEIELTLRKAGYRFDPPSFSLSASNLESSIKNISTKAIRTESSSYATGQWLVVEDVCGTTQGEISLWAFMEAPEERQLNSCSFAMLADQTGDILRFENGCLFGGVGCVEDNQYSEEEVFCRSVLPASISRTVMGGYQGRISSGGEYDEESDSWLITRSRSVMTFSDYNTPHQARVTKNMVLKRAP